MIHFFYRWLQSIYDISTTVRIGRAYYPEILTKIKAYFKNDREASFGYENFRSAAIKA
jgi:hypothetical protein